MRQIVARQSPKIKPDAWFLCIDNTGKFLQYGDMFERAASELACKYRSCTALFVIHNSTLIIRITNNKPSFWRYSVGQSLSGRVRRDLREILKSMCVPRCTTSRCGLSVDYCSYSTTHRLMNNFAVELVLGENEQSDKCQIYLNTVCTCTVTCHWNERDTHMMIRTRRLLSQVKYL